MEREIVELRKQIANVHANAPAPMSQPHQHLQQAQLTPKPESSHVSPVAAYHTPSAMSADHMGSHEAVASLLDLRSGFDSNYMRNGNQFKRIEDVIVLPERVTELFDL